MQLLRSACRRRVLNNWQHYDGPGTFGHQKSMKRKQVRPGNYELTNLLLRCSRTLSLR